MDNGYVLTNKKKVEMGGGGCGSCCSRVEDEDEVDYDPSYAGPTKDRSCTDVICLFILILFGCGWLAVSCFAFARGNPAQLINPSNSEGEICGRGDHSDKPIVMFFDLTRCAKISATLGGCPTPQICVKTCPSSYWYYGQGKKAEIRQFCSGMTDTEFEGTTMKDLVKKRKCPAYIIPSKQLLGRCIPTLGLVKDGGELDKAMAKSMIDIKDQDNQAIDNANLKKGIEYLMKVIDLRGIGEKLLSDLTSYWWMLLLALVLASVLSFGWIILMKFAAKVMIWLSIFLCLGLLVAGTAFSWYKYSQLSKSNDDASEDDIFLPPILSTFSSYYANKNTWLIFGIIGAIITLIIFILLIFLRNRISIAIELIEEASKAVGSLMSTLFFPIIPFIIQLMVILWFILVASFLASAGQKEYKLVDTCDTQTCTREDGKTKLTNDDTCDPSTYKPTDCGCPESQCVFHKYGPALTESWLQLYNMFGMFWFIFFFEALGEMVLAGAFAGWYWTMDKDNDLPSMGLMASLGTTFRYHLGTLAFGSSILTIIRMIRVILEYIEGKLKEYGADHPVVKAVTCFCKCCLYCLENCIRWINRNAYIMTAVYGKSFCSAARRSYSLLTRNAVRVVVLDKVTDFILLIGKLVVVGTVAIISFVVFSGRLRITNELEYIDLDLNYYFVPIIFITVGTYAITSTFFSVYAMAVDTIFLYFLEDIEKHDGSPEKPYFMSEDLKQILGYLNENEKEPPEEYSNI